MKPRLSRTYQRALIHLRRVSSSLNIRGRIGADVNVSWGFLSAASLIMVAVLRRALVNGFVRIVLCRPLGENANRTLERFEVEETRTPRRSVYY